MVPFSPPIHRQAANQPHRGGLDYQRGYGAAWRKTRARVLARDPYCKICERVGCKMVSTDADHIVPRSEGGADEMSNLQGVCHSCHSRKTATLNGGFGN